MGRSGACARALWTAALIAAGAAARTNAAALAPPVHATTAESRLCARGPAPPHHKRMRVGAFDVHLHVTGGAGQPIGVGFALSADPAPHVSPRPQTGFAPAALALAASACAFSESPGSGNAG
jgi:hypothetical protein